MSTIISYSQVVMKGILNNLQRSSGSVLTNLQFQQPSQSVTQFSRLNGKRKTVKTIINRFFRLQWGGWIRTIGGRHKGLYKKSDAERHRLRQHIFCTATQNRMFDKMVTKYWRKPTYYVDDIYESYHKRDNFWITRSRGPRGG